jgi:hypothetical protein
MDEGRFSISADDLYQRLGSAAAPIVIDARGAPAFEADERMVVGAIRCNPKELAAWRHGRTDCQPVFVDYLHGHEVSQGAAETLSGLGGSRPRSRRRSGTRWVSAPRGERFTLLLDGKVVFTTTDKIFADPGKVALWTKADNVTHFDAIEITPLP